MGLGSNLGKIIPNDTLPGETVAGLTTDVDDEFESDWLKLLRRSSFSRVRNPSILMIFLQPTNQGKPLKITGFTLPSHVTMKRQTTHTCKKWQIKNLLKKQLQTLCRCHFYWFDMNSSDNSTFYSWIFKVLQNLSVVIWKESELISPLWGNQNTVFPRIVSALE